MEWFVMFRNGDFYVLIGIRQQFFQQTHWQVVGVGLGKCLAPNQWQWDHYCRVIHSYILRKRYERNTVKYARVCNKCCAPCSIEFTMILWPVIGGSPHKRRVMWRIGVLYYQLEQAVGQRVGFPVIWSTTVLIIKLGCCSTFRWLYYRTLEK